MPINMNRMKTLFSPNNPDFLQATQPQVQPEMQQQEELPGMQNQSLNRFLDTPFPERNNPSILSKIGASMMSLRESPENVEKALHMPYYRDLAEYDAKTDKLLKGAQIEGQQNQYNSLANYRQGQLGLGQQRVDTGNVRAGIARDAQNLKNQLALIPKSRLRLGRGGQPDLLIDEFGKTLASYPSGTIDPTELEKLRQTGRIELANINNEASMDRTEANNDTSRGNALITAGTRLATSGDNGESATQEIARRKLRAQQLVGMHPDWADYIEFDENLGPKVKRGNTFAGYNFGGAPEEIAKQIQAFIDGNGPMAVPGMPLKDPAMAPSNVPVNNTPIGGRPDQPLPKMDMMPSHSDKVTVTKDGKTATVSQRNLQRALADGWRQ